jgi:hypothetical protein
VGGIGEAWVRGGIYGWDSGRIGERRDMWERYG